VKSIGKWSYQGIPSFSRLNVIKTYAICIAAEAIEQNIIALLTFYIDSAWPLFTRQFYVLFCDFDASRATQLRFFSCSCWQLLLSAVFIVAFTRCCYCCISL